MSNYGIVYLITNKVNMKRYVGITTKEKGFNEKCEYHYQYFIDDDRYELMQYEDNGSAHCFNELHLNSIATIRGNLECSAPYQYQLMDWLREKHNIHISILQTNLPLTDPQTDEWEWGYFIYEINDPTNLLKSNCDFETYEECLETALQETLKLI